MIRIIKNAVAICCLLLVSQWGAAQGVVSINSIDESIDVVPALSYLIDPENVLLLPDVQNRAFVPLEGPVDFGFTTDKIWLRLNVRNDSSESLERLFRTGARFMRPLEIYLVRDNGEPELLLQNDETQPFHNRPLSNLRFLAVEFNLQAQEEATFFIKFGAGGRASMSMEISSREAAVAEQSNATVGIVVFVSILGTLILVNLFHFIAVRNIAYLGYVLYEFFNMLYISHIEGFTWQYLWPGLPQWNDNATPSISAIGLIVGCFFAMTFLESKKYAPRIHRLFLVFISVAVAMFFVSAFISSRIGNQVTASMLPIVLLLSVCVAVIAVRNGSYTARYFLVAWGIFLLAAILYSGAVLGLYSNLQFVDVLSFYKSCLVAQAIILSMGLADQVRRLNNEHRRTQESLVVSLEERLTGAKERIQLEKENEKAMLQLLQKSKQLATTSHDINQPIQTLRLSLSVLRANTDDKESLLNLEKTLDHIESVIGYALDDASYDLQETAQHNKIKSMLLGELFKDVVTPFQGEAQKKKIVLKAFDSNLVIVCQEMPLKRCLMNLVSNAINHAHASKILLGARCHGKTVSIQVCDNGLGIKKSRVPELLSPLAKTDESPGHGLGLAIINEICLEYGWQFDIDTQLDRGSCFSITLAIRE